MKIQYFFIFSFFMGLWGCVKQPPLPSLFSLEKSESRLSFPLNTHTKTLIYTLTPYTDADGKEYLSFQNEYRNEILFYDMQTGSYRFTVAPALDGPDGVGRFVGYHIHTLDSIFLTSLDVPEIAWVDRNGKLGGKIEYAHASDGTSLSKFQSLTSYYTPLFLINNELYLISGPNRWIDQAPVSAAIDLRTRSVEALPFFYPHFPGADNPAKQAGVEEYFSRCYDGKRWIYSFYFDENLYVASFRHDSVRRVPAKSRYIDRVEQIDDYGRVTFRDLCENPNYGNLLYDPYREVYYRIAYPATEISEKVNAHELLLYGRKKFSILILDKQFRKIGETLFPDYTYNSLLLFIRKDGLYISDSHPMNPAYDDDTLSFRRFDLVRKK